MVSTTATIIIPSYRRFEPLLDTVAYLLKQRLVRFEVSVIDQNDAWPVYLLDRRDQLFRDSRIRWTPRFPRGVVNARNFAAKHANGDILIFVDDDVRIEDEEFVLKHLRCYDDLSISAVAGAELYLDSHDCGAFTTQHSIDSVPDTSWSKRDCIEQVLCFSRSSPTPAYVCTFCTCNSSVRRQAFERLGGFDAAFVGNAYGDDFDFAIRLWRSGGKILYSPRPWLIHLQSPQGGLRMSDTDNAVTEFDRAVSPILFALRYANIRWGLHLLYRHVLRKTILRKDNVLRPWKQPGAWLAVFRATIFAATHRLHSRAEEK